MASTYITKTFGSAGSLTTWTLSFWVKKAGNGIEQRIFSCDDDASGNDDQWMKFDSADIIQFSQYQSGYTQKIETNRKFRDINGYYHIVLVWDTTNGTAADRTRLYVNGVRETSFSSEVQASSSLGSLINNTTYPFEIGRRGLNGSQFFDGLLSHVHFCDGTALAPTVFGETDSTTGEWKINTSPSFTPGTNGFTILKDGNTITDQSANSNNFTLGAGTLTKTEDCPSNVFCTIGNHLFANKGIKTVGNAGTTVTASSASNWDSVMGNLGASTGKYYFEMKITDTYNNEHNIFIGIVDVETVNQITSQSDNKFANTSGGYGYRGSGAKVHNSTQTNSWGNAWSTNDIIGCAMDLDNSKIYFSINGTWQSSGDPTSGSTGTGAAYTLTSGKFYVPATSMYYTQDDVAFNFGNGKFGTTSVSSAGTNASGNGIFEYDCPSGYTALSTKGLNT